MKLVKFYRIDDDTVFLHTGPNNTGFLLSHDMPMVAANIDLPTIAKSILTKP